MTVSPTLQMKMIKLKQFLSKIMLQGITKQYNIKPNSSLINELFYVLDDSADSTMSMVGGRWVEQRETKVDSQTMSTWMKAL